MRQGQIVDLSRHAATMAKRLDHPARPNIARHDNREISQPDSAPMKAAPVKSLATGRQRTRLAVLSTGARGSNGTLKVKD